MSRFDYLSTDPAQPVFDGLDEFEKIYALGQDKEGYTPIRTLPGENGKSAIYRLPLTESQRQMVADGADILVEILHFGGPLAPSRVMLLNDKDLGEDESTTIFREWFCAQTSGTYGDKLKSE